MINFAQNAHAPQLASNIVARIQAPPHLNWAALVDTAFDRHKTAFPFPLGSLNCYREESGALASLRAIAPCIVPVAREHAVSLIADLLVHCDARPMLSFLAVPQGVGWETLIERWEPLHCAYPPDGNRLLLRFADTRSLAILPRVLEPKQWYAWSQGIVSWLIVSRRGDVQPLPLLEEKYPPVSRLQLSDSQVSAFVEEAETDATLDFLRENHPELIPEPLTGYDYHCWALQALNTARQYGVEGFPDRATLIALNIRREGKFVEMPELLRLMEEKKWENGELGSTLLAQPWINAHAHV